MYVKVHRHDGEVIVAACDDDVKGKTFAGDGKKITVNESFYGVRTMDEETFIETMRSATIMNLVGDGVIGLAIAHGFVSKDTVIQIGDVSHVQVVVM